MGIQGLLPCLKKITRKTHVQEFANQAVAVDAYCWLHRGTYTCSRELCEGTTTNRHIAFCMGRVDLLLQHGIKPVIVFDGGKLPIKANEEAERSRSRKEQRQKAQDHLAAGNTAAAWECYAKCVDVTPQMAWHFIQALKGVGVEYVVAPYEADAQMAYMALTGHVQGVITEDSDLLAYGCPRVLYKMDKNGEGQLICLEDLSMSRDPSFVGFTHDMFVETCILAGCDFVKALPGIGIKKAHAQMKRLKAINKVCRSLRYSGTSVPPGYEAACQRAVWTFRHQRVWSAQQGRMVHLTPLPEAGLQATMASAGAASGSQEGSQPLVDEALDFLGPLLADDTARSIAVGDLDPISMKPLATDNALQPITNTGSPRAFPEPHKLSSGPASSGRKGGPLPIQANNLSNYFASLPSGAASKPFMAPRPSSPLCSPSSGGSPTSSNESPFASQGGELDASQHRMPASKRRKVLTGSSSLPLSRFSKGAQKSTEPTGQSQQPHKASTAPGSLDADSCDIHGGHPQASALHNDAASSPAIPQPLPGPRISRCQATSSRPSSEHKAQLEHSSKLGRETDSPGPEAAGSGRESLQLAPCSQGTEHGASHRAPVSPPNSSPSQTLCAAVRQAAEDAPEGADPISGSSLPGRSEQPSSLQQAACEKYPGSLYQPEALHGADSGECPAGLPIQPRMHQQHAIRADSFHLCGPNPSSSDAAASSLDGPSFEGSPFAAFKLGSAACEPASLNGSIHRAGRKTHQLGRSQSRLQAQSMEHEPGADAHWQGAVRFTGSPFPSGPFTAHGGSWPVQLRRTLTRSQDCNVGSHEPHPAGSRLLQSALEDASTSGSSLSLDMPSRALSPAFDGLPEDGIESLPRSDRVYSHHRGIPSNDEMLSSNMDDSFCTSLQDSVRGAAAQSRSAEHAFRTDLQPADGHAWRNTVLDSCEDKCSARYGHSGILPYPGASQLQPAIADQQWVDLAHSARCTSTDPLSSLAQRGNTREQLYSDDDDDYGDGDDCAGAADPELQGTDGLLRRRLLHAELDSQPASQALRPAHPRWQAGLCLTGPSELGSDRMWQSLSCNSSGMDAFQGSHLRVNPSACKGRTGQNEEADQDGGMSPSPLRRHPWALDMASSRLTTQRPPRRAQLHISLPRPDTPAQPSREPLDDSSGSLLPSWLHGPRKQHHQNLPAATRSDPSDQHSLRLAQSAPLLEHVAGPSAMESKDRHPALQPEALAAASAPEASQPGAEPALGGPGSSGSDETGSQGPQDFHSLAHIHRFAKLAGRTVDRVASQHPISCNIAKPKHKSYIQEYAPVQKLRQNAKDEQPQQQTPGGSWTQAQHPNQGRAKSVHQRGQQHDIGESPGLVPVGDPGEDLQPHAAHAQIRSQAAPGTARPPSHHKKAAQHGLGQDRGCRGVLAKGASRPKQAAASKAFRQFACGA
ncbi:hypothetical protein WJX74_002931 [Apatococcus lobatus]|uniref:Exonuclease 1 n=1 Tax=Apatococcus lobatus TaxID=904363 RepID=A0AAW1QHC4_9CHLO